MKKICLALEKTNIELSPLWILRPLQPIFDDYPAYANGILEDLLERGLFLPSGSKLAKADLRYMVKEIKDS